MYQITVMAMTTTTTRARSFFTPTGFLVYCPERIMNLTATIFDDLCQDYGLLRPCTLDTRSKTDYIAQPVGMNFLNSERNSNYGQSLPES